ncbi:unnamed protein product, partial [Ixodes persulcatus]
FVVLRTICKQIVLIYFYQRLRAKYAVAGGADVAALRRLLRRARWAYESEIREEGGTLRRRGSLQTSRRRGHDIRRRFVGPTRARYAKTVELCDSEDPYKLRVGVDTT